MFGRVCEFVRRHAWIVRAAAISLALIALLVALQMVPLKEPLGWLIARVDELGPWGPAAFVLAYVLLTSVLLPSTPVALAAGAVFGPVRGAVVVSIASAIAAALSFGVGRWLGHHHAARWIERYPKLRAIYHAMGREHGWKVVVAVRLAHAAPFGLQNYLFGMSPTRFWPYLVATWVTMLPGAIFYAYIGDEGAEAITQTGGGHSWLAKGAFLLVAVAALTYLTHFARRVMREQMDSAPANVSPR
jgi:uncharacterized membrane protein YdjX (TVP38/TMEM64 family)